MLKHLYKTGFRIKPVQFKSSYKRLIPSQCVEDGVVKQRYLFDEFDIAGELSRFTSSDFSLDNILNVGAVNMLQPVVMLKMSDMNFADQFANFTLTSTKTE